MRKIYTLIFLIIFGFICINSIFYIRIYNQQLDFQTELLTQQISICGNTIEQNGMDFESEVNYILFSSNISELFSDTENKERNLKNLELFYTKYADLISNINIYNDHNQVYRLLKDKGNNYVRDFYESQRQEVLERRDILKEVNGQYQLIIPVFQDNQVNANIVIGIDYEKYINTVFDQYRLKNTLWQWFITGDGKLSVTHPKNVVINDRDIQLITSDILEENTGNLVHSLEIDGEHVHVISVYYPVNLVRKDFGIVFSIKSDLFLRSIFQKTIIIIVLGLLILALICFINFSLLKTSLKKSGNYDGHEVLLGQMIDNLPSGLIIIRPDNSVIVINQQAKRLLNISTDNKEEITRTVEVMLVSPSGTGFLFEKYLGPGKTVKFQHNRYEKSLFLQDIKIRSSNQDLILIILSDLSPYEKTLRQKMVSSQVRNSLLEKMRQQITDQLQQINKQVVIIEQENHDQIKSDNLRMISKSNDHLSDLINSTLDFSKFEADKAVIEEIPFRFRNEMNKATDELKPAASAKKISIIIKIRDDVPDRIIGDPFRLRQIISGLMENSLGMTGEGRILLNIETLIHYYDKLRIRFQVEDTGSGFISKVNREQDRINADRDDVSPERAHDETLLKIDKIRQQIELLNGELNIESPSSLSTDPDHPGTSYSFTLDLIPDESHKKNLDYSGITEISAINCLILSREEYAEEDFMSPFHEIGCTVKQRIYIMDDLNDITGFLSGKKNEYQILLIHDRPVENDLELLTCLNQYHLDNDFLIVVLNTDDQLNNFLEFKRSGADYYLVHPYDLIQLTDIISNHFPGIGPENFRVRAGAQIKRELKILLADDNILGRKNAQTIFKKLGFEIDCVSSGVDAIEKISDNAYDIVFLDLLLPLKDGVETTAEIRKLGYKMPVIALTTVDITDKGKTKKIAGISSYLVKPLKLQDIRRILMQNFPVKS